MHLTNPACIFCSVRFDLHDIPNRDAGFRDVVLKEVAPDAAKPGFGRSKVNIVETAGAPENDTSGKLTGSWGVRGL
jgi:hypothetical protein